MAKSFRFSLLSGENQNICHLSSCIPEPTCRHPSSASLAGSEVPSSLAASPRGKPRTQKPLASTICRTLPQPRYAQQLFNFGMIATGNHNFERFAALCNTPGGSQGRFAPAGGYELPLRVRWKPLDCSNQRCTLPQSSLRAASSLREGAKGASRRGHCPAVPLPQWVCSLITLCSRMPRT